MIEPTDEMMRAASTLLFPWTDAHSETLRHALAAVLELDRRDRCMEPPARCSCPPQHCYGQESRQLGRQCGAVLDREAGKP